MSNNRKASVLIGLGIVMGGGVCDANAATTPPVTDTFSLVTPMGSVAHPQETLETLVFPQFNPSLGTLTSVDFSLISSVSGIVGNVFAQVTIPPPPGDVVFTQLGIASPGPFDFTDVSGLFVLTTAFYTGSGAINIDLTLTNAGPSIGGQGPESATWTGNGTGQGLTLVYDYTPAAPATPIPAALPLFATGLGALGLLGWRRKRKARVSLLGAA